ncbi:Aminoglycoside phosphotransferase [Neofusicoccum parvum]|nr:Aminoglycoside phosphotransferase [Neofusicoccum parvum]
MLFSCFAADHSTEKPHSARCACNRAVKDVGSSAYARALESLHALRQDLRRKLARATPRLTTPRQPQVDAKKDPELDASTCDVDPWGPVLDIPDYALVTLVHQFAHDALGEPVAGITVLSRIQGSNNAVYIVQYDGAFPLKLCVRIPACGWGDRWTAQDADALRNIALTMRYVKQHTSFPVPEVLQSDTTFNNPLGAPYILMTYIEGRPLPSVWNDTSAPAAPPDPPTNDSASDSSAEWDRPLAYFRTAPAASLTLEAKRQKILHSLATTMSALHPLTFPLMGPLVFPPAPTASSPPQDHHPTVAPAFRAPFGAPRDARFDPAAHVSTAEPSSRAFYARCLAASRAYALAIEPTDEVAGVHNLFALLLQELPWPPGGESFVLAPPDLAAANVLVDDGGRVVGVVGWDGVESLPRCLGWAAFPDFLGRDWAEGIAWEGGRGGGGEGAVLDGRAWDAYRADYAEYLEDACRERGGGGGGPDGCRYARKSHLYRAVLLSLGDLDRMRDVLDAVLAEALPRVRRPELVAAAGDGVGLRGERERVVRIRFRELLACD